MDLLQNLPEQEQEREGELEVLDFAEVVKVTVISQLVA
jgi:hypothetical protein